MKFSWGIILISAYMMTIILETRRARYMTLTWFIIYIYYRKQQFLNHIIIIKSN